MEQTREDAGFGERFGLGPSGAFIGGAGLIRGIGSVVVSGAEDGEEFEGGFSFLNWWLPWIQIFAKRWKKMFGENLREELDGRRYLERGVKGRIDLPLG